jgi:hypothetical protein
MASLASPLFTETFVHYHGHGNSGLPVLRVDDHMGKYRREGERFLTNFSAKVGL